VATLKNLKYYMYFDLFHNVLVTTWFHMCYFIILMSSLLCYNVENSKNEYWYKGYQYRVDVHRYEVIEIDMYSEAKTYLVSHQLCKFSHLKRWERPVIVITGRLQLRPTKWEKNPEK
jgi:hypothetical protein